MVKIKFTSKNIERKRTIEDIKVIIDLIQTLIHLSSRYPDYSTEVEHWSWPRSRL